MLSGLCTPRQLGRGASDRIYKRTPRLLPITHSSLIAGDGPFPSILPSKVPSYGISFDEGAGVHWSIWDNWRQNYRFADKQCFSLAKWVILSNACAREYCVASSWRILSTGFVRRISMKLLPLREYSSSEISDGRWLARSNVTPYLRPSFASAMDVFEGTYFKSSLFRYVLVCLFVELGDRHVVVNLLIRFFGAIANVYRCTRTRD